MAWFSSSLRLIQSLFLHASMSIHGWVQNQKLDTEIEILGLTVRRTSITFQVIIDATLLKWNVCIAVFHTNVFWLCVTRKLAECESSATRRLQQHTFVAVLSLARYCLVFFVYRHMLKRCSQQQWKITFCFFKQKLEWRQLECNPCSIGGHSTFQGYVECKLWKMVRQVENDGKWTLNTYTEAVSKITH